MGSRILGFLTPLLLLAPVSGFAAQLDPTDSVGISFWVISMCMVAATVFFLMETLNVSSKWRTSMVLAL